MVSKKNALHAALLNKVYPPSDNAAALNVPSIG